MYIDDDQNREVLKNAQFGDVVEGKFILHKYGGVCEFHSLPRTFRVVIKNNDKICAHCCWFKEKYGLLGGARLEAAKATDTAAVCTRRAPQLTTGFPAIRHQDTCGDWEEKRDNRTE